MAELYGSQYAKDILWRDPELRFAHFLTRLCAERDLREKVEARSNLVINGFAALPAVQPAYAPYTFFFKNNCYIALENGENTLKHLAADSYPKDLNFETTLMVRSLWTDPEFRNIGLASEAISSLMELCKPHKFAVLCVPRIFEFLTGYNTVSERQDVIKANPSWRMIPDDISNEHLDLVYGFYEKLGFEEMPPDKSFKVPRGIMIKSFQ